MQTTSKVARRYAPRGVDRREIPMRLMPDERQHFDELAAKHNITDSALAREIYLAGLPVWEATQVSA